ncbi:MAG: hypothetical protein JW946_01550 [Candidatus Omnitrophica bacterium]|nr:hypothetical protein [Candidatus Omnitrophota bacterium]
MEIMNTVDVADLMIAYATIIMAVFTMIILLALVYCALLIKRVIEGIRIYLKFASMQQAIMNKNIINLFPGAQEDKLKAKKELDAVTGNILNDIETF